jgi:predicted metalloprotease
VLQSVAKTHGITRFDEAVVGTVIEKVYADLKPTLPQPLQTAVAATVRSLEYNDVKEAA